MKSGSLKVGVAGMVMPARLQGFHESGAVPASLTRQKTDEPGTGRVGEDKQSEPHETPRRFRNVGAFERATIKGAPIRAASRAFGPEFQSDD